MLDEIFWAIKEGLVGEADVLALIRSRAPNCELILTGRGSTPAIEEASDYVSSIEKRKHPFDSGVISRAGIELLGHLNVHTALRPAFGGVGRWPDSARL